MLGYAHILLPNKGRLYERNITENSSGRARTCIRIETHRGVLRLTEVTAVRYTFFH